MSDKTNKHVTKATNGKSGLHIYASEEAAAGWADIDALPASVIVDTTGNDALHAALAKRWPHGYTSGWPWDRWCVTPCQREEVAEIEAETEIIRQRINGRN